MLPGTWVIYDTVAGNVKEAGAEATDVIGLIVEESDALITAAPGAKGDIIKVITGGEGKVMIRRVANAGNIVPGTPLVTAADGLAGLQAVGALGTQGEVVAIGAVILADSTVEANVIAKFQLNPLSMAT
jgi:hypothetical protein